MHWLYLRNRYNDRALSQWLNLYERTKDWRQNFRFICWWQRNYFATSKTESGKVSFLILVPLGFLLDLIFGNLFFIFPNEYARTGIEIPAIGGGMPIEEFIFYISGFIYVLLAYLWSSEYWFKAYSVFDHLIKAKQVDRIIRFDPRSVVLGAILIMVVFINPAIK